MMTLGEYRFVIATTPALMEAIHRLRYKVYVEEYGFEKAEDHPDGLEKDAYDPHSFHVAALDSHGRVVGTIRGILNNPLGLPALQHLDSAFAEKNPASRKIAEVSRLALDASLRGNLQDNFGDFDFYLTRILAGEGKVSSPAARLEGWQKRVVVLLGLIQQIYHVGQLLNITDFYMVAEKRLGILLKRYHVNWHAISPEFEYHGARVVFKGHDWEIGPAVLSFNKKITTAMGLDKPQPSHHTAAHLAEIESFFLGGFRFAVASKEEELEQIFALRRESKSFPESDSAALFVAGDQDRQGRDMYDPYSIHLAAWDRKHQLAAALRVTLNSSKGLFSLKKSFLQYPDRNTLSKKVAEMSRLIFAPPYRYAFADVLRALGPLPMAENAEALVSHRDRRRTFLLLVGLFRMIYRISKRLRLTKWYARMDVTVAEFLARHGIFSHCIGPTGGTQGNSPAHVINFHEVEPAMLDFKAVRAIGRDLLLQPGAGFTIHVDSPYSGNTAW